MDFLDGLAQAISASVKVALMRYFPVGAHQNADHASINAEMTAAARNALAAAKVQADDEQTAGTEPPDSSGFIPPDAGSNYFPPSARPPAEDTQNETAVSEALGMHAGLTVEQPSGQ